MKPLLRRYCLLLALLIYWVPQTQAQVAFDIQPLPGAERYRGRVAQDAGMSLRAFEAFLYGAVLVDWDALARLDGMIVCYVRGALGGAILDALVEHGRPAEAPARSRRACLQQPVPLLRRALATPAARRLVARSP